MNQNNENLGSILIAEDEPINFMLLQKMLEKTKYAIIWAKNGEEAVQKAKTEESIKIIFMDIRMPVLSGIEAIKQIRDTGLNMPIYAVTAYTLSNERDKCKEAGADGFITKPVNPKELMKAIDSISV